MRPLPLCPILLPSLNDTAAPTLSPRFSLRLSSGRLDYVAKEIFSLSLPLRLSLFFLAFFSPPYSHWFGVNAFWMPLGVCRALGGKRGGREEGRGGGRLSPSVGISIQSGEGGGPKERHSCENWSGLQSQGTFSPNPPPPSAPPLFMGHSFIGSPQVHCQSSPFIAEY